jgi:ParB/RepB/Spo0J family partition protein
MTSTAMDRAAAGRPVIVHVDKLHPTPGNRPDHSGDEDLAGLTQTIRVLGVLQNILAEPIDFRPGHYTIRAGHRRWLAAQRAGLTHVPVIIRRSISPIAGQTGTLVAVVENCQRSGLGPVELALKLDELHQGGRPGGMSQADIARWTGLAPSTISYHLQLARADKRTLDAVRAGTLKAGAVHKAIMDAAGLDPGDTPVTQPNRGHGRRSTGTPKPKARPHFDALHRLAAEAAAECDRHKHPASARLNKVACGPCFEAVIIRDALNSGGRPLQPPSPVPVPVPAFTGGRA